jgi:hypothetical protein
MLWLNYISWTLNCITYTIQKIFNIEKTKHKSKPIYHFPLMCYLWSPICMRTWTNPVWMVMTGVKCKPDITLKLKISFMRLQEQPMNFKLPSLIKLWQRWPIQTARECFLFYFINTLASMGLDRKWTNTEETE